MTEHDDDQVAADVEPEAPAEEQAPPAPAEEAATAAAAIAYNDRVACWGMTGSGKSELLNHLFTAVHTQKLLLDTKDEFSIPDVEPVHDVAAIDWSAPVIHYIDATGEPAEFDRLFAACRERRHLVVAAHELGDLCQYKPNATGSNVIAYIAKGVRHGQGLLGGSQRPACLPVHARTETAHVFVFAGGLADDDDHRAVAKAIGVPANELYMTLERLQNELGFHAFLWFNRRSREIVECAALPEHVRAHTIVRRRTVA